jgi:hypothetical protein
MEPKSSSESFQGQPLSEILGRLAGSSAALVRDEIALVKQQALEKIKDLRSAVIMMAAGCVLAVGALWCFAAAMILLLCLYMPPGCAAATIGAVLLAAAAALAYFGMRRLRKPVP